MLFILDSAVRVGYAGFVNTPYTDGVAFRTAHAVGNDTVGLVCCDGGGGIMRGLAHLGIKHDAVQPEMHETNANIEKHNTHVIDGTRPLLGQAGLPPAC